MTSATGDRERLAPVASGAVERESHDPVPAQDAVEVLGGWVTAAVGVFLGVGCVLSFSGLFWSWEVAARAAARQGAVDASLFGWEIRPTPDLSVFCVVVAASAIGSMVHALMSFTTYAGNRQFRASWIPWYLLRVLHGVSLALILYSVTRAGLLVSDSSGSGTNLFGAAAVGGMAGLFAKQAADKLEEIFDTIFRTGPGYGDATRRDPTRDGTPMAG